MSGIVLLTGATGFVGRQVLRCLCERGIKSRLVVRAGKADSVKTLLGVESVVVTDDLFNEKAEWWENVLRGVETIIHVAWYVDPANYLQSARNIDCLMGTLEMARAAALAGVKRFVGIGTCFEYDLNYGTLYIDTPLRPTTPYAGSKAATFMALSNWLPKQGVEFVWCRLFYLYGEGEDPRRLVPYLRTKIAAGEPAELTSGHQVRDFLDVSEAGLAIALTSLGNEQGALNICSGVPVTVREIAERIASEYGRVDLLNFGLRAENFVDPLHVVGVNGYSPN